MSIFSLQTKKHLVGWSVVLGLCLGLFFHTNTERPLCRPLRDISKTEPLRELSACDFAKTNGWPFNHPTLKFQHNEPMYEFYVFMGNILFWIFVSLIILSLIRHFRKPKY